MRSHIGVFVGNLVFTALCLSTGPVFLVLGGAAWHDGASWGWAVSACGAAVTVMIPVLALRSTRAEFPRIAGGDRVRDGSGWYGDDTFVMRAPRSEPGPVGARLVRADVLEASSVRYDPDGEATFTTYVGETTHPPSSRRWSG
ncbi:hypothetical protein [Streptomyces lasiicapitis]|uniref:hypothetical protein n=1 Tax=Streptomyces lasiicapitis TaxID=1923961 RepID=UPI0036551E8A